MAREYRDWDKPMPWRLHNMWNSFVIAYGEDLVDDSDETLADFADHILMTTRLRKGKQDG